MLPALPRTSASPLTRVWALYLVRPSRCSHLVHPPPSRAMSISAFHDNQPRHPPVSNYNPSLGTDGYLAPAPALRWHVIQNTATDRVVNSWHCNNTTNIPWVYSCMLIWGWRCPSVWFCSNCGSLLSCMFFRVSFVLFSFWCSQRQKLSHYCHQRFFSWAVLCCSGSWQYFTRPLAVWEGGWPLYLFWVIPPLTSRGWLIMTVLCCRCLLEHCTCCRYFKSQSTLCCV